MAYIYLDTHMHTRIYMYANFVQRYLQLQAFIEGLEPIALVKAEDHYIHVP